jgi:bifunctional non-homologous end joining protein LigD
VATPVDWQEVERGASPRDWTLESVPDRLAQKEDPWAGLMRHALSLTGRRERLDELLARERPAEEESD